MKKLLSLFSAVLLVMSCMVIPATTVTVSAADSAFVWDFEGYALGETDTAYSTFPSYDNAGGKFVGDKINAANYSGVLPAPGEGKGGSDALKLVWYTPVASGSHPQLYMGMNYVPSTNFNKGLKVSGSFKTKSVYRDAETGALVHTPANDYKNNMLTFYNGFTTYDGSSGSNELAVTFKNYDYGIRFFGKNVPYTGTTDAMADWQDFEYTIDIATGDSHLIVKQNGTTIADIQKNWFDEGKNPYISAIKNVLIRSNEIFPNIGSEIIFDNLSFENVGNLVSAKVFDMDSLLASADATLATQPKGFTLDGKVASKAGVIKNGATIDLKNVANNPTVSMLRGMSYDAVKHKVSTTITPAELANRAIVFRDSTWATHDAVNFTEAGNIVVGSETIGTYTAGTTYQINIVANENTGLVTVSVSDGVNAAMSGSAVLPSAELVKFAFAAKNSTVASITNISAISYTPGYRIPVTFTDTQDGYATATVAADDLSVINEDLTLMVNVYDKTTNQLLDTNVEAFDETVIAAPEIRVPFNENTQYAEAYLFDSLSLGNTETAKVTLGTPDASTLAETEVVGTTYSAQNSRVDGSITIKNAGIKEGIKTLLMLKDGVSVAEYAADPENTEGYIRSFENATVDGTKFGFTAEENAVYNFYVNKNDGKGFQLVGNIRYVAPSVVIGLVEDLNASAAVYKDIVLAPAANEGATTNAEMLNLDTTVYVDYTLDDYDYAQRYLEQEQGEYTADTFKAAFEMMQAVRAAVNATTSDEVIDAMDTYLEPLRYDLYQVWETYEALEEEKQTLVLKAVADAPTFFDFEAVFEKYTIFTAIKYAGNQVNVKAVLDAAYDIIGISEEDYSDYCDLIDKAPVNKALRGKTYTLLSDIADDFEKALEKQIAIENGEEEEEDKDDKPSKKYQNTISIANGYVPPVTQPVTPGASSTGFADVAEGHWAAEGISYLAKAGIVNGKAQSEFAPDALVKREEVAKMIVLAFGGLKDAEKANFGDVSGDAWYAPYIATAVANGFVSGYSAEWFGIGDNVSRQDMAVMIYKAAKAFGLELAAGELGFTDNDAIADYAKEGVSALVALGSISGRGDGSFDATATATRAEIAKILYDVMLKGGMTA